jgi:hypothetical protein
MLVIHFSKLHYLLNYSNFFLSQSFKTRGEDRSEGMAWSSSLCLLEDVNQAFLEAVAEEKPHVKPYFSKTIRDLEVVEGSAARFDCKIEGKL